MELLSTEEVLAMGTDEQAEYLELIKQYQELKTYNKQHFFKPYGFQKKFYNLGSTESVRALIAANRVGKTYSAAMELSFHLTGIYPDWWEGKRWDRPIKAVAAGVSAVQVRRVLQKELVGTDNRDILDEIGTGSIPKHLLNLDITTKVRDGGLNDIAVKHVSGGTSTVSLFSYTQGMTPMQGFSVDCVWLDEQDKNAFDDIFSELVKRIASTEGIIMATFTPLQGLTHIVNQFWDPHGPFHSGLVTAGWDDVTHLTKKTQDMMFNATPPHLRDAVSKGIPVLGAGAVFNIAENDIVYDDIEIGDGWPKIAGIDVGFTNDPTAGMFLAKDPSTGVYYFYDEYGEIDNNVWNSSQHIGPLHAKNCSAIPIIYDSAAAAKVGAVGKSVVELWREHGLNVLTESFKNPQWINEGTQYKAVAPGLNRMYELMATDKLKVHRKCSNWWREFRKYSYDDKGTPSQKDNHWIDASRYALMSAERGLMQVTGHDWSNAVSSSLDDEYYFHSWN